MATTDHCKEKKRNESLEAKENPIASPSSSTLGLVEAARSVGQACIEKGFAFPLQVLSPQEADRFRIVLEDYEREVCQEKGTEVLTGDDRFKIHLLLPEIWDRIVHHPAVVAAASAALNCSNVWCWSTDVNTKEAKSGKHFTWHQDSTYAKIFPPIKAVTVWLALTPSTEQSGCVRCIPYSHRSGQVPHVQGQGGVDNALTLQQAIVSFPTNNEKIILHPDQAISMVLQPGQASVHNFLTIHASFPNQSAHRRIGLALRFVSAHVNKEMLQQEFATLVSGDGHGLFATEQRPSERLGPAERRRHAQAMARERANYLPSDKETYT